MRVCRTVVWPHTRVSEVLSFLDLHGVSATMEIGYLKAFHSVVSNMHFLVWEHYRKETLWSRINQSGMFEGVKLIMDVTQRVISIVATQKPMITILCLMENLLSIEDKGKSYMHLSLFNRKFLSVYIKRSEKSRESSVTSFFSQLSINWDWSFLH